jgi:CheY-like chemotaxis protein
VHQLSPLVAVFNNSPDLINLLATWLETHGMRVVCGSLSEFRRGHEDVEIFLSQHRPAVLLLDVSMPYEPNWDYVEVLRLLPATQGMAIIVTTANKRALEAVVGPTDALEITGSVASLTAVTDSIRSSLIPPVPDTL